MSKLDLVEAKPYRGEDKDLALIIDDLRRNMSILKDADLAIYDTQGNLNFKTPQRNPIIFSVYTEVPSRSGEDEIHGGLEIISAAGALGPATPANDLSVSTGTGKLVVVVNAGSDLSGQILFTGDTIDRNTGVKTVGDTEVVKITALTTDDSTTDSNGNAVPDFTGAYITNKWFTGTVVLSTATLNLSDIDVYHIAFEQVNSEDGHISLDAFDATIFTLNTAAEFDAYIHTIHVGSDKTCHIKNETSLHVGADGETALVNRHWRLRKGNLNRVFDGHTDGFWVDLHYANSPIYVEDVNIKVWFHHIEIPVI